MSEDFEGSPDSKGTNSGAAGKLVGGLFKKAVTLGAEAYVKTEDKVSKTLTQIPFPKDFVKDAIESFFDNYTLNIQAEVKMSPKRKENPKSSGEEKL